MAQENSIDAVVYPMNEDAASINFDDVQYVSFVSSPGGATDGTYGIPAKIAEEGVKSDGLPFRVLYINPANIAALELTRTA